MRIIRVLERIAKAMEAQNVFEQEILESNQRHHDESMKASRAWYDWNKQNRAEDLERIEQNRTEDLARIAREHADFMHIKELDRSVNLQIAEMGMEMQREHDATLFGIEAKTEQGAAKKGVTRPPRVAKLAGPITDEEK